MPVTAVMQAACPLSRSAADVYFAVREALDFCHAPEPGANCKTSLESCLSPLSSWECTSVDAVIEPPMYTAVPPQNML